MPKLFFPSVWFTFLSSQSVFFSYSKTLTFPILSLLIQISIQIGNNVVASIKTSKNLIAAQLCRSSDRGDIVSHMHTRTKKLNLSNVSKVTFRRQHQSVLFLYVQKTTYIGGVQSVTIKQESIHSNCVQRGIIALIQTQWPM